MVVGPKKLPGLMRTIGEWVGKIRKMTTEMRAQTGIDDILRQEGIDGVHELRSLLRGEIHAAQGKNKHDYHEPEGEEIDLLAEYPLEGADAYGALAEDLLSEGVLPPTPHELPPRMTSESATPKIDKVEAVTKEEDGTKEHNTPAQ